MRIVTLLLSCMVFLDTQTKSLSYYTDKAKSSVKSAYSSVKNTAKSLHKKAKNFVDGLDPKTVSKMKKGLIAAGVTAGAIASAAAIGYAATELELFGSVGAQTEDEKILTSTVNMLKNDPKYTDDIGEQFRYLLSTDMNIDQIDAVLDMANPTRGL